MTNEQPSNIFDYSQKMGSGSKKPKKSVESSPLSTRKISDEEAKETIVKIKEMHREIELKIDDVCKANDVTIDGVVNFLQDPKNFAPEVWNQIQVERKNQMDKLWDLLGVEEKKKHSHQIEDKQSRERKAKSIGARKKGWISM